MNTKKVKCTTCGVMIGSGPFSAHAVACLRNQRKDPPQSTAFVALPGDPVGKVRWALDMLRGVGAIQLRQDLEAERQRLISKVAEIDEQIETLRTLNAGNNIPQGPATTAIAAGSGTPARDPTSTSASDWRTVKRRFD